MAAGRDDALFVRGAGLVAVTIAVAAGTFRDVDARDVPDGGSASASPDRAIQHTKQVNSAIETHCQPPTNPAGTPQISPVYQAFRALRERQMRTLLVLLCTAWAMRKAAVIMCEPGVRNDARPAITPQSESAAKWLGPNPPRR